MLNRAGSTKLTTKTSKKKKDITPVLQSVYSQFDRQEVLLLRAAEQAQDYVWLELKLVDWHHADFTICIRTNTPLWSIRRYIKERHAHVERLQIFRAPAHKKNEILDYSLTLDSLGIVGGSKEANMRGVLFYNFKPIKGDAIVLREPQLILEHDEMKEREARGVIEDMGMIPRLPVSSSSIIDESNARHNANTGYNSSNSSGNAATISGSSSLSTGFSALGGLK